MSETLCDFFKYWKGMQTGYVIDGARLKIWATREHKESRSRNLGIHYGQYQRSARRRYLYVYAWRWTFSVVWGA